MILNFSKSFVRCFLLVIFGSVFAVSILSASTPVTAKQFYEKGQEAQNSGEWYTAVEFYQEAVRLNNVYGDAWYSMAECTYALGEYSLALTYLETAEKYAKNHTDILNLKGFCYLGLEKTEEAEKIFKKVLNSYPNNIEARFGLAQLDILAGRLTGAENLYLDALKRQQSNRNALLSVALVAQELGKIDAANTYIDQALRYHSNDAEVQYVAAWISYMNGNLSDTEFRVRTAVNLNPNLDKAYELLANVLFRQKRFQEAMDICDFRLNRNRNLATAWYLKGLSLLRLNEVQKAYNVFETGLSIVPRDEIMRVTLEQIVLEIFDIEDTRRAKWAKYHVQKAREYEKLYQAGQAEFEYKKALRLNPLDTEARTEYAAMLDRKGQQELYLEQLNFINAHEKVSLRMADTIEAYKSLLSDTLAVRWNVDSFFMDKIRWTIGLYPYGSGSQMQHVDAGLISVKAIANQFAGIGTIDAYSHESYVTYSEAYRNAREAGQDFFILVETEENERELLLVATIYSGRNGTEAGKLRFYRTGNDRYCNALRRLCDSISEMLPVRGLVIDRNADDVLIDLGSMDGIAEGSELVVVKAGQLYTPDQGMGITYDEKDVLGTITINQVSESLAQGRYSRYGFFDRMNVNDEVILSVKEETETESSEEEPKRLTPNPEEITGSEFPVLSRMLQELYLIK